MHFCVLESMFFFCCYKFTYYISFQRVVLMECWNVTNRQLHEKFYVPAYVIISIISIVLYWKYCIFTCVAKGESRSTSRVTPSVCPSVRPKILSSQLLWNYWSEFHETWYVDRTSYGVMHIGRKFWSPYVCGSYAPWNLENIRIFVYQLTI